jgi:hypothetical protein
MILLKRVIPGKEIANSSDDDFTGKTKHSKTHFIELLSQLINEYNSGQNYYSYFNEPVIIGIDISVNEFIENVLSDGYGMPYFSEKCREINKFIEESNEILNEMENDVESKILEKLNADMNMNLTDLYQFRKINEEKFYGVMRKKNRINDKLRNNYERFIRKYIFKKYKSELNELHGFLYIKANDENIPSQFQDLLISLGFCRRHLG